MLLILGLELTYNLRPRCHLWEVEGGEGGGQGVQTSRLAICWGRKGHLGDENPPCNGLSVAKHLGLPTREACTRPIVLALLLSSCLQQEEAQVRLRVVAWMLNRTQGRLKVGIDGGLGKEGALD